jgi:hypothetical protein
VWLCELQGNLFPDFTGGELACEMHFIKGKASMEIAPSRSHLKKVKVQASGSLS